MATCVPPTTPGCPGPLSWSPGPPPFPWRRGPPLRRAPDPFYDAQRRLLSVGKGLGSAVNRTRRPSKAAPAGRKPGRPGRETARGGWLLRQGLGRPTPAPSPVPLNSPGPALGRGVARPAGRHSSKPAGWVGSIVSLRLPLPPASSLSLSSSCGPASSGAFLGSPSPHQPFTPCPEVSTSISARLCPDVCLSTAGPGRGGDWMASGRDFQGLAVPWSPASIPSLGGTGQSSLTESGDKYRGWIFF